MFRPNHLFARQPSFGFDEAAAYGQGGEALIGVKTHLGWARPRWTPSGSMWLDGEDFSLPLNRFDVRTLEPVFGAAKAAVAMPVGSQGRERGFNPGPNDRRGMSAAPSAGQRHLVPFDAKLGRASSRWSPSDALSVDTDDARGSPNFLSADEITSLSENDLERAVINAAVIGSAAGGELSGSFGSEVLRGGDPQDTMAGRAKTFSKPSQTPRAHPEMAKAVTVSDPHGGGQSFNDFVREREVFDKVRQNLDVENSWLAAPVAAPVALAGALAAGPVAAAAIGAGLKAGIGTLRPPLSRPGAPPAAPIPARPGALRLTEKANAPLDARHVLGGAKRIASPRRRRRSKFTTEYRCSSST